MFVSVPVPTNEKIMSYEPGSVEREMIKKKISEMESQQIEIPAIINGKDVYTGNTDVCIQPHQHDKKLAVYHKVGKKEILQAIDTSVKTRLEWEKISLYDRLAVFLKAAELLSKKHRYLLNAATMLGQSKNVHQAEIDSACELIDFWRFNAYKAEKITENQPMYSPRGMWNSLEYRPLEGFIFAVTPFNFTSIAGNLPTAPAIMGNTTLWKPAQNAVYSAYYIMRILQEAGLPDGVINFIPGSGAEIGDFVVNSQDLAGVHFTGSTNVFSHIWQLIGNNIKKYKNYPRFVGETGGKDFIVAHKSAKIRELAVAAVRGAFEYQGQKCSAASRMYIPDTMFDEWFKETKEMLATVKMGPVQDFKNFINAVIDKKAYDKIKSYIDTVKQSNEAEVIWGGKCDDSQGYFIEPTIIKTSNPKFTTMEEEIFGPVLTVYPYPENKFDETLTLCDQTSPYALTGSIFAEDRHIIEKAFQKLRHSAGNFYINDKPTAAVVGQQPFGGSRASGTNDKAGSELNLYRWISVRSIKESFNPPTDYEYPFMK